jgi:hypothetical protein
MTLYILRPINLIQSILLFVKKLKIINLSNWTNFTSCSNDNMVHKNKKRKIEKMHVEILSLSTSNARIQQTGLYFNWF